MTSFLSFGGFEFQNRSSSLFLALMLSSYVCSSIECLYAGMIVHKFVYFNNLYPILELHKITFSLPCLIFTLASSNPVMVGF